MAVPISTMLKYSVINNFPPILIVFVSKFMGCKVLYFEAQYALKLRFPLSIASLTTQHSKIDQTALIRRLTKSSPGTHFIFAMPRFIWWRDQVSNVERVLGNHRKPMKAEAILSALYSLFSPKSSGKTHLLCMLNRGFTTHSTIV